LLARELSQQFQSRTVEKTYLALVRGGSQSFPVHSGQVRAPLKFVNGRPSIGSLENGKRGETDWELVASSVGWPFIAYHYSIMKSINQSKAPVSFVRLRPRTGLKHQLRVHLAHSLHSKAPLALLIFC
jgi:23S rRNA-/tRNA-specific pseudouridylate synthase